ncbi:MAG: RluA family pseudouridine synthase, partial [Woeseiaceae bacterium]|nr:RluA family pseudouridine synthase [Woeseiaceae bacterium]NIP22049.1 RluA family pseudouridine synthase [Woeseiaceae bacterium]
MRKIRIDAEHDGQRVDNFLRRELPGVPKGRVYRMLRRGEVRVNGGRVRPEYKLCQDDELRLPPVRVRINSDTPPEHLAQGLLDRLIYEDKQLLVVDKPAGLAVHGGSGIAFGAVELLRHARPDIRDLELVHRLDRETSGCLVLAKRRSALRELHARFREGRVEKNYLGLVAGRWELGDRMIDAPLLVQHRRGGERYVIVSPQGKPARTRVRLARQVGQYSLLRCEPLTGRTHQIRVHLKHAGFPLLGDERYGESG